MIIPPPPCQYKYVLALLAKHRRKRLTEREEITIAKIRSRRGGVMLIAGRPSTNNTLENQHHHRYELHCFLIISIPNSTGDTCTRASSLVLGLIGSHDTGEETCQSALSLVALSYTSIPAPAQDLFCRFLPHTF